MREIRTERDLRRYEPTSEDIRQGTTYRLNDRRIVRACWYPQMGGYVAKAWIAWWPGDDAPCFYAVVWHDGDFPFGEDDDRKRAPAALHHCGADQFIRFGEQVQAWQEESNLPTAPPTANPPTGNETDD